eukprot:1160034-Pelagomonas_calceolata.AAC.7
MADLEMDIRKMMMPNTALNLRVRHAFRSFVALAAAVPGGFLRVSVNSLPCQLELDVGNKSMTLTCSMSSTICLCTLFVQCILLPYACACKRLSYCASSNISCAGIQAQHVA